MQIAVHHLALACCAVEVSTAIALDLPAQVGSHSVSEFSPATASEPADLHVLVVAGTVSLGAKSSLNSAWMALPEPRMAIAYGVCASSGGPYWDSYSVTQGAAEFVPISRFVPGCPPPRSTLLDAVLAVAEDFADGTTVSAGGVSV